MDVGGYPHSPFHHPNPIPCPTSHAQIKWSTRPPLSAPSFPPPPPPTPPPGTTPISSFSEKDKKKWKQISRTCYPGCPTTWPSCAWLSFRRSSCTPSAAPGAASSTRHPSLHSSPSMPSSPPTPTTIPTSPSTALTPSPPSGLHSRPLHRTPDSSSTTLPSSPAASPSSPSPPQATSSCLPPPPPSSSLPSPARWRLGPPFPCPRRWCAAGAAAGVVYLASGVGPEYNADVARSAARWDPRLGPSASAAWEPVATLRHGGRFSREPVEFVATRGKLCLVNMRGRGAKEGIVYDVLSDRWEDMPPALLASWTGPAASADDDGSSIYVVDEGSGALREYDWEGERWRVVVPESGRLKGAVQMAAGGGRVCVVNGEGATVVVVDVAARPGRMWEVEPPRGKRVVALHVLPRMTRAES